MNNLLSGSLDKYEIDRNRYTNLILNSSASNRIVAAGPGTGKTHLFKQTCKKEKNVLNLSFINELVNDIKNEPTFEPCYRQKKVAAGKCNNRCSQQSKDCDLKRRTIAIREFEEIPQCNRDRSILATPGYDSFTQPFLSLPFQR